MTIDQISGYAAHSKSSELKPFSYHPRPLGEFDVDVQIACCGICHSDIHTIDSGWGPTIYPCIPGHEIVGKVVGKGSKVSLEIGQRVGVGPMIWACLEKSCRQCSQGKDNLCPRRVFTYSDKYPDGQIAHGGYATHIRAQQDYVFAIPDVFSDEEAAPLLCAGATVYAPLKRANVKSGMKVGVCGIGGLGHLAVQYASKMGAEVTCISSSPSKAAEASQLGATHFCNSRNEEELKKFHGYFDVVLNASSGNADYINMNFSLLAPSGTLILVGLAEENLSFRPNVIVMKELCLTGSIISSKGMTKEMFEFSAKHGVKPWIQTMPMKECNEGIKKVRKNDVKYRMVLKN